MSEPSPRFWEIFFEVYEGLPRQGPGSRDCAARALALCRELPPAPAIADLGCGVGGQTLQLAEFVASASIVAIDSHAPSIERLQTAIVERGLERRVRALAGDMARLDQPPGSFDLVWSEGALYNVGLREALRVCHGLLRPGGYLAFTDAVWRRSDPPPEVRAGFDLDYPAMGWLADDLTAIEESGFDLVGHFTLPEAAWWDEFYTPMEARLGELRGKYADDGEALAALAEVAREPELHRSHAEFYAYEFFVARRPPGAEVEPRAPGLTGQGEGRLQILPCLDAVPMAAARRRELDIPKEVAAALGRSAVAAARAGRYVTRGGREVVWREAVQAACAAKVSLPPDAELPSRQGGACPETRVQVTNETTLGAARRLVGHGMRPLALNFANGIHPGGGFRSGARAQEEVLCRSSALFLTLEGDPMYAAHRRRPRPDSTDWAIYSPDVPFFREDGGAELEEAWLLSVLTCAAPYAPGVGQPEAGDLLQRRIHRVLAIARAHGHAALVLGAWGCGAFGNDPHRTARDFREALEGPFAGAFADIVFAIADWSPERRFLGPFREVFACLGSCAPRRSG